MRLPVLILALFSLSCLAAETVKPSLEQAASQRLLAERIAKTYAWRGLEPSNAEARKQYDEAAKLFEKQLQELKTASKPDAELSENYALLEQLWADYKTLTAAPATREGAKSLSEQSEELAWIAQKGSQLIEARGNAEFKPLRMAEDIATVSQRLAKIYLLQSYGVKLGFLPKDLAAARAEFETLSKGLKALPGNSQSQKGRLSLMDSQWFFFQQAIDELAKKNDDPQLRRNVITTSERIYEIAQELANGYQRR
ncbi:hypothetical protein [Chitinimonas arctica]|uniref:hypothetical protein n=1 Tax=Chitinimonas arctica TaxID=2594795 RepID=UPI0015D34107|nr:hypothetical protein [Chitinimonas arctica]